MDRRPRIYALLAMLLLIGYVLVVSPVAIVDVVAPINNTTSLGATQPTETPSTIPSKQSPGTTKTATETEMNITFQEASSTVGFNYTYLRKRGQSYNDNAGVYAVDYDKNGWTDLLAVGGKRPVLFRNDGGTFSRSRALPRLNKSVIVQSAVFFDYDDDGWEDLLLLRKGRSPLLLENDHGKFHVVEDAGFNRSLNNSIGASVSDYNHDGCRDVFIIQYGEFARQKPMGLERGNVPLSEDNGNPNYLYQGNCSSFKRVNATAVRGNHWTLATSFTDLTGDGWPDIHVANDFNHDLVYVNQRNGTFERHVLNNATDRNAMSSEIADVNGDGRPDIFVTNIWFPERDRKALGQAEMDRYVGNTLLINQGNATFLDRAKAYTIKRGGWGWAAVLADFDNDMDQDLFHTTLRVPFEGDPTFSAARTRSLQINYSFYLYPMIAERTDDGFARLPPFPDMTGFNVTDGRGVASLDFDHDGDLDLIVGNGPLSGDKQFRLYENVGVQDNAIQLRVMTAEGAPALGATVTVTIGGRTQTRWVTARTDYFSQDSRVVHFGTGEYEQVDLTVVWSDGTKQTLTDVAVGQTLTIAPNGTVSTRPFD